MIWFLILLKLVLNTSKFDEKIIDNNIFSYNFSTFTTYFVMVFLNSVSEIKNSELEWQIPVHPPYLGT